MPNASGYIPLEGSEPIPQAEAVPQVERPFAHLTQDLTWEDNHYEDKIAANELVAVFDIDEKTASTFRSSRAMRFFLPACLLYFLGSVVEDDVIGTICVIFSFLSLFVAISFWKKSRAIVRARTHMAVTTRFVQYDQESPQVHVVVRMQRFTEGAIVGCSPTVFRRILRLRNL